MVRLGSVSKQGVFFMRFAVALAVMFALAGAWPSTASAQTEAVREARRHMEAGQEFFLQEDWGQAAEAFMAAFALRPHTAFLYNAALAYHRLGEASEALGLYQRYLQSAPNARDRADVERRVALLERAATATQPDAGRTPDRPEQCAEDDVECLLSQEQSGQPSRTGGDMDPETAASARSADMKSVIFVEADPSDATIILLDEGGTEVTRGQAPVEYTADGGRYALVLEHPEYRQVRTPIQVSSGRYYIFHIEMSQPPAFLQVTSSVPGSTVYLDDRTVGSVGTTPWGDVVRPGSHQIWIERPGFQTEEQTVEIGLGQEEVVAVDLERLPFGMVRVLANVDEASVQVDGQALGAAPVDHQLDPGEHRVAVTSHGMKDYETTFDVTRGQTTRVLVRLNPRPSRTSAWVSMAFSIATFTAAGIVGWYSSTIFDDLEHLAQAGRLASDDSRVNQGMIFAIGADVGFGIGAIVAGLTLYYFLRDPLPDSEGRVEEPVDFTENPELPGDATPAPAPAVEAPATEAVSRRRLSRRPRLQVGLSGLVLRF